ncbi:MAG: hypothetical protein ABIR00_03145 [Nitrosospira sp.]
MNELMSTLVLATFTTVCSFGAVAGSDSSNKNEEATPITNRPQAGPQYGAEPASTADINKNQFPKDLSPEEKAKLKDQESVVAIRNPRRQT